MKKFGVVRTITTIGLVVLLAVLLLFVLSKGSPTKKVQAHANGLVTVPSSSDPLSPSTWSPPVSLSLAPKTNTPTADLLTINGLSCPSVTFCAAIGPTVVVTSTDPTGGSAAWKVTPLTQGSPGGGVELDGVTCPSATLCVLTATGSHGTVITSTDPTGGVNAWIHVSLGEHGDIGGATCPSSKLCLLDAGYGGTMFSSVDPGAGQASAWIAFDPPATFTNVSCPSDMLCIATASEVTQNLGPGRIGKIFETSDPASQPPTWTESLGPSFPSGAVAGTTRAWGAFSCPAASLCLATADSNHDLYVSRDPGGGARSWNAQAAPPTLTLSHLQCPSPTECVSAGDYTHDPASGVTSWKPLAKPDQSLWDFTCRNLTICVGYTRNGITSVHVP